MSSGVVMSATSSPSRSSMTVVLRSKAVRFPSASSATMLFGRWPVHEVETSHDPPIDGRRREAVLEAARGTQ